MSGTKQNYNIGGARRRPAEAADGCHRFLNRLHDRHDRRDLGRLQQVKHAPFRATIKIQNGFMNPLLQHSVDEGFDLLAFAAERQFSGQFDDGDVGLDFAPEFAAAWWLTSVQRNRGAAAR